MHSRIYELFIGILEKRLPIKLDSDFPTTLLLHIIIINDLAGTRGENNKFCEQQCQWSFHSYNMENGEETTSYFDCAEKLAAANIAASTSTLSWESKL